MHFFAFGVTRLSSIQTAQGPTAYASCWINVDREDVAKLRCVEMIRDQGWEVVTTLESHSVCRDDYGEDSSGLNYFEQAIIDHEVLVFVVPATNNH